MYRETRNAGGVFVDIEGIAARCYTVYNLVYFLPD